MSGLILSDLSPGDRLPELALTMSATRIVAGALASRDYSPLHHDRAYVAEVGGQCDIFANTQFQAALFERYVQDWAGPLARVAQMRFRMGQSVFAGDEALIGGTVKEVSPDGACGASAIVAVELRVGDTVATGCEVLVALPAAPGDNPWSRRGADWLQPG
jgi:acyl dehydratase